jgi:hypothetical protein
MASKIVQTQYINFLLCYEFVQFLTPSKNLTDPSTFSLSTRWSMDLGANIYYLVVSSVFTTWQHIREGSASFLDGVKNCTKIVNTE